MIHIDADNVLRITGEGTDFDFLRHELEGKLTWINPDYVKREQMGKWTGNTPRKLTLVERLGANAFIVPFGMLKPLYDKLKLTDGFSVTPSSHLMACRSVCEPFSVDEMGLYPYQLKAVREALKAKGGIVVAPCGSGKTQMGLAICGALGLRTLWLTHTHELLKQSMNRAISFLGADKKVLGTITEGKVNCGEFITFATVQTMAKIDIEPLREFWDVVIVDECHKAVGTPTRMTMFWKVISGLSARYKYGLTATPERGDGMHVSMFALLGQGIVIDRQEVRDTTCPLVVNPVETGWEPEYDEEMFNADGTLNYVGLVNVLCRDDNRNKLIAGVICGVDGAVMVLSERIEHLRLLEKKCSDFKRCVILSTASKKDRNDAIKHLNDGDVDVLFATYQLAKEGLDIPNLRHLVMASPVKDEITVTQSAGRVMRKYPEKDSGVVWDFCDDMRMLKEWHYKRMRTYRKLQNTEKPKEGWKNETGSSCIAGCVRSSTCRMLREGYRRHCN